MEAARAKNRIKTGSMDFPLFITVILLCAIGIVMVFSASYYSQIAKGNDGLYYVSRQLMYLAGAIVAMIILAFFDYHRYEKLSMLILCISVALLVLVLIIGTETNGAKRWIRYGPISLQPSEVAKFGLILYMSSFMAKRQHLMMSFKRGLMPMLLVMGVICGLVMLQPNMSMAVIIGMMGITMLFVGGAKTSHVLLLILAGIVMFVFFAIIEPYRFARLTSFTDPWKDPKKTGYQLIQSLYALGSGSLFGQGLNNSRQKLLYLTYGESDFVFAIIGEELGFVGAAAVIVLYAFIVFRSIRIALKCRDRYGSLLAAGISIVFALQVLVNIGVVTGVMPTTGQALPFISAGGSSLLIFMSAMGILLNISRHTGEL